MHAGHEKVVCSVCKAVIRQCRCPGPHPVTYEVCAKCKAVAALNPSAAGPAHSLTTSKGWRVRDPQRIVRNACLEAKEECPVGGWYANHDQAIEEIREWFKKWAHQLHFQSLDNFARIATENGWWLCTKIQIGDPPDPVGLPHVLNSRLCVPYVALVGVARSDVHGAPDPGVIQGCIQDVVWFTLAFEPA